ncbi:unnamed protein product [Leptidea sinapis]|uniref:EF-hand domain-containing protein n=1 Tax=Leptidea sinapis TaxID=189913 RepID=A0A5E4Q9H4_9NEOP|nr:unnamed protein product [Leptidea sinapis]
MLLQPGYGQPGNYGQLEMGHGPYPSVGAGGTVSPQVQQWFRAVDKDQSGMFDKDRSGTINLEEFDKLYTYINQWLAVFKTYDTDQSGHIEEKELSQEDWKKNCRLKRSKNAVGLYHSENITGSIKGQVSDPASRTQ